MQRFPRLIAASGIVALCVSIAACGSKPNIAPAMIEPAAITPAEVGAPLYPKQELPKGAGLAAAAEAVVVHQAILQPDERATISSQVDGTVLFYGVKLAEKPAVLNDGNVYVEKYLRGETEVVTYYRRLREGDTIRKDQEIVRLDEELLAIQLRANLDALEETRKTVKSAEKQREISSEYYNRMKTAGTSMEALQGLAQVARAEQEYSQSVREQARLKGETGTVQFKYTQCYVKSPLEGRIVKFLKNPGDGVKAGEQLMEVQSAKRFRAEGKVDVQDASRIQLYTPAEIVPARPTAPRPLTPISHRREVAAIAVSAHDKTPLVVSGGLDASALVWEPFDTNKPAHVLPHPIGVGVKAVAISGKEAGNNLCVTGGTDGKLRLWDINDPKNLPTKATDFEEGHGGSIAAIAFSADGRYLATAAGREVFVWSMADRKKKYALPADHRDDVTALRFTPQCTLVTVCRDKAVRAWVLGESAAALDRLIDNRSGTVDVLGTSTDGSKVLFDQDANRLDLVGLDDSRTVVSLRNGGGARFGGFALFGGLDDRYVLTGGGDTDTRGEMQLWEISRADISGKKGGLRASERRRLVAPNRAGITAAAFSPNPARPFIAAGTVAGGVHIWEPPAADEKNVTLRGKVTAILPADSRTTTLRVEFDLPDDEKAMESIKDRGLATILIDPNAPPERPNLPMAAPSPLPKLPGSEAMRPGSSLLPAGGFIPVPMKK